MAETEQTVASARVEDYGREEQPSGKLSRKLLGIIIIGIALLMAVGMMLSNMGRGGGEADPKTEQRRASDPNTERESEAFLAELRRQEEEALRRRQEEEARRRLPPGMPRESVETEAVDEPAIRLLERSEPREPDRETILRERAAQSPIIALQGHQGMDSAMTGERQPWELHAQVGDPARGRDPRDQANAMVRRSLQEMQAAGPGPELAAILDGLGRQNPAAGPSRRDRNEEWLQAQRAHHQEPEDDLRVRERFYDRPVLHEGSIIPTILQTAVHSDLPGMVTALVTRDIWDSIHGKTVVIPRGSRIVGEYNSDVMDGQRRLMFAFHRIIFPDGRDVKLGTMAAHDEEGRSGMRGRVNTHFWSNLWRSSLIAAIAIGAERQARPPDNVTIIGGQSQQYGTAASEIFVDLASDTLGRNRNRPPTITIKAGSPFTVMVNNDIVL